MSLVTEKERGIVILDAYLDVVVTGVVIGNVGVAVESITPVIITGPHPDPPLCPSISYHCSSDLKTVQQGRATYRPLDAVGAFVNEDTNVVGRGTTHVDDAALLG